MPPILRPCPHPCRRRNCHGCQAGRAVSGSGCHGDSPVVGFDGIGVSDVLGLIVQPAVRFHGVFIRNLSRSVLVPKKKHHERRLAKLTAFITSSHSSSAMLVHTASLANANSLLPACGTLLRSTLFCVDFFFFRNLGIQNNSYFLYVSEIWTRILAFPSWNKFSYQKISFMLMILCCTCIISR